MYSTSGDALEILVMTLLEENYLKIENILMMHKLTHNKVMMGLQT